MTGGGAFRADRGGGLALIRSVIEFVAFEALSYRDVFFYVRVVIRDDLREEFEAGGGYFIRLLLCREFELEHMSARNDSEVIDIQVVLFFEFSYEVVFCIAEEVVINATCEDGSGREALLRFY